MKFSVDPVTQAVYVDSPSKSYEPVAHTARYADAVAAAGSAYSAANLPEIMVDLDARGRLVGVEIIWAGQKLRLTEQEYAELAEDRATEIK